jgi:hypothetical protein
LEIFENICMHVFCFAIFFRVCTVVVLFKKFPAVSLPRRRSSRNAGGLGFEFLSILAPVLSSIATSNRKSVLFL